MVRNKKRKRTKAQLEAELAAIRRVRGADALSAIFGQLFKWVGLVGIFYWIYKSIDSLAGKHTFADIGIKVEGDLQTSTKEQAGQIVDNPFVTSWLPWAVAIGLILLLLLIAVGYGLRQRKLRRTTIERLQGRIKSLERNQDPNRTSSGLTPQGQTHPRDK